MWLFNLLFCSLSQLWYVEVRISRVSESPLEFEITRVDCIWISSEAFHYFGLEGKQHSFRQVSDGKIVLSLSCRQCTANRISIYIYCYQYWQAWYSLNLTLLFQKEVPSKWRKNQNQLRKINQFTISLVSLLFKVTECYIKQEVTAYYVISPEVLRFAMVC